MICMYAMHKIAFEIFQRRYGDGTGIYIHVPEFPMHVLIDNPKYPIYA